MSVNTQNDPLMEKFVNYIMKDGKKSLAKKLLADTLTQIKAKGHKKPLDAVRLAIENVLPKIEVRPKRV
jgi:small subunit ribosomal protein S7